MGAIRRKTFTKPLPPGEYSQRFDIADRLARRSPVSRSRAEDVPFAPSGPASQGGHGGDKRGFLGEDASFRGR